MNAWTPLLPEATLCAYILVIFIIGLFEPSRVGKMRALNIIAGAALLAALAPTLGMKTRFFFFGAYQLTAVSQFWKILVASVFLASGFFKTDRFAVSRDTQGEYRFLLGSAALGLMILVSAGELVSFWTALELSSYSFYVLTALTRKPASFEAGVKYFLFGAVTSALFLYGMSFVVGFAGSTQFGVILHHPHILNPSGLAVFGIMLAVTSLLFKLAAVPFHFWAPDAYEAAPLPVTAFISTASKIAALAVLVRLYELVHVSDLLVGTVALIAFLSMTIGNLTALVQKSVKRLMAYSSIAQAGYLLMGVVAVQTEARQALVFYAASYAIMNTAVFWVLDEWGQRCGTGDPQIRDLRGLSQESPLKALVLLLGLLSLAGIPPLVGFAAKWFLFAQAMKEGFVWLVIAGVLNSVLSLYYYLGLVKEAYLYPSETQIPSKKRPPVGSWIIGWLWVAALVIGGFFPQFIMTAARSLISA